MSIARVLRSEPIQQFHDLQKKVYDFSLPGKKLGAFFLEHGMISPDMLSPFSSHEKDEGGLYAFRDTHFSPKGSRMVANLVADFLMNHIKRA